MRTAYFRPGMVYFKTVKVYFYERKAFPLLVKVYLPMNKEFALGKVLSKMGIIYFHEVGTK